MSLKDPPTLRPTNRHATRGKIDWDVLYKYWLDQNKPIDEFLAEFKHIKPDSVRVRRVTDKWTRPCIRIRDDLNDGKELNENDFHPKTTKLHFEDPNQVWQLISKWRIRQAVSDFEIAEKIKDKIKYVLDYEHYISPQHLNQIAKSLEVVQKVQRLALGLSTEHIGIENQTNPLVDKTNEHEDQKILEAADNTPTFIVEMNDNGKFKRLKPRQVNEKG